MLRVASREKLKKQQQRKQKKPTLLKQTTIADEDKRDPICALKSSIACPSHLLRVLLKQTDLDEPTIHARYIKFRREFPAGLITQQSLLDLCRSALDSQESEALVNAVFRLYGRNRSGWHLRFIGFREVVLATECIKKLHKPERVLRWIFKVNDFNGIGAVAVTTMVEIVDQILSLCLSGPVKIPRLVDMSESQSSSEQSEEAADELNKHRDVIMDGFHMMPYGKEYISEEEFVFDCLNNTWLYKILEKSVMMP